MGRPDETCGLHKHFDCGDPTYNEHETVYPVKLPGQGHGMAIAYIDQSPRHYHERMAETYYILDGELDLELGGAVVTCGPGQSVTIPPGWVHCAKKHTDKTVCLIVFTLPPFDPTDYHLHHDQENIADRAAKA